MRILWDDYNWLRKHGEARRDGIWVCKLTKAPIKAQFAKHEVTVNLSGKTEVKEIPHLFCPACIPDYKSPSPLTSYKSTHFILSLSLGVRYDD